MRCLPFLFCTGLLTAAPPLPQGVVVERVVCESAPRYSFSAYVPTSYRPGVPMRVLLGISPGGDGREPVRLFRGGAERHGWILIGSHDARNGPRQEARNALRALWKELQQRFSVDVKGSVVGGFSGGARMAMDFLRARPELAGLISIGAFGIGQEGVLGLKPHVAVLLCGQEDFNHLELLAGAEGLRARGWRVWADRFPGGHRWPPREWGEDVLDYLEWDALAQGKRAPDPDLESRIMARRVTQAREAEGLLAQRRWAAVRAFGPSAEADAALERWAKDPLLDQERILESQLLARMREIAELRGQPAYVELLTQTLLQARSGSRPERLQARRVLGREASVHLQAWYEARDRKDWPLAERLSRNLGLLQPEESLPWLLLACSLGGQGRRAEALKALARVDPATCRVSRNPRSFPGLEALVGDPEAERIFTVLGYP